MAKKSSKDLSFNSALKSFLGYLEGTDKSAHTLSSYRIDLEVFRRFLQQEFDQDDVPLKLITRREMLRYYEFLKTEKFKTNTRRRRLLTVRRFLRYLKKRQKISLEISEQVLAPAKVERVPETAPYEEILAKVMALPVEELLDRRTRLLFWTLLETGCRVSELTSLKFADLRGNQIQFYGKNERLIDVSAALIAELRELEKRSRGSKESEWIFLGFNRFGALGGGPISDRAVELIVKAISQKLGYPHLTPRKLRHTSVLYWCEQEISRTEIQKRLGLKTPYLFKIYEPIIAARAARAAQLKEQEAKSSS